ncbi:MAG: 2-hydroxy-3-keto-5-methylthiopentenyl-1-phosphate phosphatase, partial [Ignavibacteriaceae bacterium]
MNRRQFKIFIDFDGTISQVDIGESLFQEFGNKEKVNTIIDDLLNEKISSKQSWIELCDLVFSITSDELNKFIDAINVDSTFPAFTEFCKE